MICTTTTTTYASAAAAMSCYHLLTGRLYVKTHFPMTLLIVDTTPSSLTSMTTVTHVVLAHARTSFTV